MIYENSLHGLCLAASGLAAAAGMLVLLATPAPAVAAEAFHGPYAGVSAGYESYSGDLDGVTYGAYAGWNVRLGNGWVVGPELRFSETSAKAVETSSTPSAVTVSRVAVNNQFGGQLRVGRLVTPSTLLFVTGGYERFDVDATTTRTPRAPCTVCTPVVSDFSFREDVWTAGAGVEWAMNARLRLRASYTYADGEAYHRHGVAAALAVQF